MPRGRPREFDVDDALDAAMRLFWRRGFRATTTRDLERALGVGQSSITSAFGAKADLAAAALDRYLARLRAGLIDPLRDADAGLSAIDAFLAGLSDWHCADGGRGCLIGRLMCDGAHEEPPIAARVGEYRRALRAALDAALARAVRAGELPAGGLEERRELLVAVILGMNLAVRAGYDVEAQRALARAGRAQVAAWRLDPRVAAGTA
ncbi:TetR/AcrR family transcriptional regulator [Miltoncostaea marina]|uniref:TetR/AcrR family transcriptional regulator n=1 Tax=Miltoncostaea marina TaxID=2843215 RepID=UPI001C3E35EE|nr:helix-turn-helix domain-containing protein [Miltoncostaea marina]